jgi:ABC-type transport system involved in multi-copper enzyme maturation permease subunit
VPTFIEVLRTQWRWARAGLAPCAVVGFTIPILAVQSFNNPAATGFQVGFLLSQSGQWSAAYPVLAAAVGLLVGFTAWSADHRGRHVYALSLPLPRWQLVFHRFAAGLVLLAAVTAFLWTGAWIAGAAARIPPVLQAYPHALTARFFLASLLAFAVFFAVSAGTARSAGLVLGAAAVLAIAQLLSRMFGTGTDLLGPFLDILRTVPGPLAIFGGRWLLIDF